MTGGVWGAFTPILLIPVPPTPVGEIGVLYLYLQALVSSAALYLRWKAKRVQEGDFDGDNKFGTRSKRLRRRLFVPPMESEKGLNFWLVGPVLRERRTEKQCQLYSIRCKGLGLTIPI